MTGTGELSLRMAELESNLVRARDVVQGLNRDQFNWHPAPRAWSIAQALTHLNRTNRLDLDPVREAVRQGRASDRTAPGPFRYGWIWLKFLSSMEPPVKKKMKAPALYVPPPEAEIDPTLEEYRRIIREVMLLVREAEGLDLAAVRTRMPALPAMAQKLIRMPLGARFALLAAHDRRHLWQAEQVRRHSDFPAR